MLKIRELEAFDAYMRLGGMQSAAEETGLSQPMISRLLAGLEKKLGFALFFTQTQSAGADTRSVSISPHRRAQPCEYPRAERGSRGHRQ